MSFIAWGFSFFLFFIGLLTAYELPLDESVKMGVLDNGLVYYLRKNEFPKGGACIRFVVKAGSLHEEEEERGLAHFLEHMSFRGSKNVADWEMVRYLESVGAKFGADTNACTSFDRTIYELDLPIASNEILERGLFILADLAGRATLDQELIEKEKGVVLEEYNLSKNAERRLTCSFLETFCEKSLYPKRIPIGLKEVILGADATKIRAFYEKWYRPDRMAVIVVGDCDTDLVEGFIKNHFAYLQGGKEPPIEPSCKIEFSSEKIVSGFIDKELSENSIKLIFFQESGTLLSLTKEEVRSSAVSLVFKEWFKYRLKSLTRKNPPSFLSFHLDKTSLGPYVAHSIEVSYFEDEPLDSLKALYIEMASARKFGPTAQALALITGVKKEKVAASILLHKGRKQHAQFAEKYLSHFLSGKTCCDEIVLLELIQEALEEITTEDIRLQAERDLFFDDFHIFFTGSQEGVLSKEMIETYVKGLEDIPLNEEMEKGEAPKFAVSFKESNLPYSERIDKDSTILSLQNGLEIVLHPSSLEKNQIIFRAFAKGGKTLFTEGEYQGIGLSSEYIVRSGLGNLNGQELHEYLEERGITYDSAIFPHMRRIELQGSATHFEDYCRLFLATFQERRSNRDVLENLIACKKEILKRDRNHPRSIFFDCVNKALFSSHPFYQPQEEEKGVIEEVERVLSKAFGKPEEYRLVIVGDFSPEEVKPILLSYLNYQTEKTELPATFLPPQVFPKEDVKGEVCLGTGSSSFNYIAYGVPDFSLDPKEFVYPLKALTLLLQDRLLTKMRHEMGEIYTCTTFTTFPLYPSCQDFFCTVFFSCEPGKESFLKEVVYQEIRSLLEKEVHSTELETLKALVKGDSKKLYQYNSGWLRNYDNHVLRGFSLLTEEECFEEIEQMITKEKIAEMAKYIFENRVKVEITGTPST